MRSTALLTALTAATAVQAGSTLKAKRQQTITPVTTKGNAFFVGEERFYVRGIAYQPGGQAANLDPLANTDICLTDLEKFKDLGVNVVRVYMTDNSLDHDECMNAFAEAGIYLVLDLNNPKYSINRGKPAPSYNHVYLQSVFATIDAFAKYPNTMAFFSGNEVVHDQANETVAARYVKATTRDSRRYLRERGYRQIPVGYSAADVSQNRMQTAHYFNCGTDDERSDFFAFNDYSWCTSDFVTAGWGEKVQNFTGYGLPIFLSEFGCVENTRNFREIESLMHSNMTHVYSGGLMFEYSMEPNEFGIVEIAGAQGNPQQTGARKELPEYEAFKTALSRYPAPTGDAGYTSTTNSVPCPTVDPFWQIDTTLLPKVPEEALKYFEEGAGKGPGLNGVGSQWNDDFEHEDAEPGSGGVSGATGGSEDKKNAAPSLMGPADKAPLLITGALVLSTLLGAIAL